MAMAMANVAVEWLQVVSCRLLSQMGNAERESNKDDLVREAMDKSREARAKVLELGNKIIKRANVCF